MNEVALGLAIFAFMLAITPSNDKPYEPTKPIDNPEKLAIIANYCLRYQKQPYINNCINDRSKRNFIEVGK